MSNQIIGHAIKDIKAGDIIHITTSADGDFLESPEIEFTKPEAELPKAETSEHVEPS